MKIDIVVPSLDCGTVEVFNRVNRPAGKVNFRSYIDALISFSKEFPGELLLETFIVPGMNDTPSELESIREIASGIHFDVYHVNSLHRPGTENYVKSVSQERLEEIARFLGAETVQEHGVKNTLTESADLECSVVGYLGRRPGTVDDLVTSTGCKKVVMDGLLSAMKEKGILKTRFENGKEYFLLDRQ